MVVVSRKYRNHQVLNPGPVVYESITLSARPHLLLEKMLEPYLQSLGINNWFDTPRYSPILLFYFLFVTINTVSIFDLFLKNLPLNFKWYKLEKL